MNHPFFHFAIYTWTLHWRTLWTQVCQSGDLEADHPPRPAFYNQPTIAADIFTMPQPTKLYISIINIISSKEV